MQRVRRLADDDDRCRVRLALAEVEVGGASLKHQLSLLLLELHAHRGRDLHLVDVDDDVGSEVEAGQHQLPFTRIIFAGKEERRRMCRDLQLERWVLLEIGRVANAERQRRRNLGLRGSGNVAALRQSQSGRKVSRLDRPREGPRARSLKRVLIRSSDGRVW